MPVAVVINNWGGLPSALRENVKSWDTWGTTAPGPVILGYNDMNRSFDDAVTTRSDVDVQRDNVFKMAKEWGMRTILIGPVGWRKGQSSRDPRKDIETWGVDECSLFSLPDEGERGDAQVYDDEYCDRACAILDACSETDGILLWINLLCCRDLTRIRFGSGNAPAPPSYDRRTLPSNVASYIDGISGSGGVRRTETEYATLLNVAWDALDRHSQRVKRIVLAATRCGGRVAHTASHSLAIGEHSVQGADAPLGVCCETFWSSTVESSVGIKYLRHCVIDFVAGACGAPQLTDGSGKTPTTVGSRFTRYVFTVRDHIYACVAENESGQIKFVFDTTTDPEETVNVLNSVSHLMEEFQKHVRQGLFAEKSQQGLFAEKSQQGLFAEKSRPTPRPTSERPVRALRPPSPSPPPPSALTTPRASPTRPPSIVISPSAASTTTESTQTGHTVARQLSFSRRPQRDATATPRTNIRKVEHRLNKIHRDG